MNLNVRIGQKVKELRLAAGLSQTALGRKTGMSPQLMHKYEHGNYSIRFRHLMAISEALNFNIHDLIVYLLSDGKRDDGSSKV